MATLPVEKRYLSKSACIEEARRLISEGTVHGMEERQLAREIFFHASVYYYCLKTGRFQKLKEKADPINLDDHGDTRWRRLWYAARWLLSGKS